MHYSVTVVVIDYQCQKWLHSSVTNLRTVIAVSQILILLFTQQYKSLNGNIVLL